jgi:membrane-bound inhibitor of C-type lysozyme
VKKDNKIFIVIALLVLILAVLFFWRMNINQEGDKFVFVCPSGDKIHISYGEEAEEAYLSAQDKNYNLHRAISASGARYTSEDEKVVFWEHQGEVMLEINGEIVFENCVLQEDFENEKAIRQVVDDFGRQLKNVSLLAPEEQVREDMEEHYGDLVVYESIKKWFSNPLEAPGRLTSSPWPEKIEIDTISEEAEGKYLVKGKIIEITSIEEYKGGKAAERKIDIFLAEFDGDRLITGVSLGDYSIVYTNNEYDFSFFLPQSWNGYSIISSTWEGFVVDSHEEIEEGPMISIRHPDWTAERERQDIPIMIFTINQWNAMQEGGFHIGAAPINPRELGRNNDYVFALPARYNFAFPEGFEEVDDIIESNPLKTF